MPFAASMYVVGPLIAFGVIAALGAVLRWAFDSDAARTHQEIFSALDDADYGLLSVAGIVESPDEARIVQQLLAGAGIRATTAPTVAGTVRILVFSSELEQARRVVGGPT